MKNKTTDRITTALHDNLTEVERRLSDNLTGVERRLSDKIDGSLGGRHK